MKRFWQSGDPFVWLTGGALALSLVMVAGLVLLVMWNGLGFFWPAEVVRLTLKDGTAVLGQIVEREAIPQPGAPPGTPLQYRLQVKQGNRDLYGADFVWVDEASVVRREVPPEVVLIQRREWGDLYGTVREVRDGETVVAQGAAAGWAALQARLPEAQRLSEEIGRIEKREIGGINFQQEKLRLALRRLELMGVTGGQDVERLTAEMAELQARF
jgi:phosphate transport system permease protein